MKSLQQNTVKWPLCVLAKFFTYLPSMTFWSQEKKKMTFADCFAASHLFKTDVYKNKVMWRAQNTADT